ncbi:MAG: (2Fe-2S)-binding protein [Terriglobales bacterium]
MAKRRPPEDSNPPNNSAVSRRAFLKGAGMTAAGGAVLDSGLLAQTGASGPKVMGPDAVTIALRVNGAVKQVAVEPRTTLADALRNSLDMTGTKVVCDRGSCSACTVWLDSMPVNSCMTFALDVGERGVTTIEGLAKGGQMHPLQAAFVAHDALQCGYCTPGMVMSCAALLERKANPTLDDVRQATSGNLCRCGTYPKVFAATLATAKSRASVNHEEEGGIA